MLFGTLAFVAAASTVARGFLIPPNVESVGEGKPHTVTTGLVDAFSRVLELDCPGCLFAETAEDGSRVWTEDSPNKLFLNFSVNPETPTVFEVNGAPLYPVGPLVTTPEPIYVPQISSNGVKSDPLRVWYMVEIRREQMAADSSDALIPIRFHITAIDEQFVQVQPISIHLIKSGEGKVFIVGAEAINESTSPSEEEKAGEEKECTTLLCKWRHILESKFHGFKFPGKGGCHGRRPAHTGHGAHKAEEGHKFHESHEGQEGHNGHKGHKGHGKGPHRHHEGVRPHGHHAHAHYHHRHGALARAMHFIHRMATHVIIPISVGIVGGMAASLIGMLMGRFIVFLWVKLFRGGRRGPYSRVPAEEREEFGSSDEKPVIIVAEPPQYEDVVVAEVAADKQEE